MVVGQGSVLWEIASVTVVDKILGAAQGEMGESGLDRLGFGRNRHSNGRSIEWGQRPSGRGEGDDAALELCASF